MNAAQVRIIWMAILLSIVVYGVMVFVVIPAESPQPLDAAFSNPVVLILHIAGVGMLLMSFVVPSILMRRAATPPAGAPGIIDPSIRVAMIIRWAMTEGAAVCGLVAALLGTDARLFLPLGALALAGMLMAYPSNERLLVAQ